MIDWKSRLREGMRGIAVEGKDDKLVLEAFLDAGVRGSLWQDWRSQLAIEIGGGFQQVLNELSADSKIYDIWAVLDREWRSDTAIQDMLNDYPKLRFLPRRMIENYAIDPDELWPLLPAFRQQETDRTSFRQSIEANVSEWVIHGALLQALYEPSQYFRRPTIGYPNELTHTVPIKDDDEIATLLTLWQDQLNPERILANYRQTRSAFRTMSQSEQYQLCIDGKRFFQQVICPKILNQMLRQKYDSKRWFSILFEQQDFSAPCPDDLKDLLMELVG